MEDLKPYRYVWPQEDLRQCARWHLSIEHQTFQASMPETLEELQADSRWPAFFPSPICFVTTTDGRRTALEKVVGASIVNRFPYVVALSFCRQGLSDRHHVRGVFTDVLEQGGAVAIQYFAPGGSLDATMGAIMRVPEEQSNTRIAVSGLPTRRAVTNPTLVFEDAYLVYEAELAKPGKDFEGNPIFSSPWIDIGSHRVYFLEITAIQLRRDIAEGHAQIHWRSLPAWTPQNASGFIPQGAGDPAAFGGYTKGYTPHYAFPSPGTIAFEPDCLADGMAVKVLPPLPEDQVEVDDDRARWPCFFPSSAGLITVWSDDGLPNLMPCGSTTLISRHPLVITPCVSYAAINQRYAPRKSLELIRNHGRFGCGVPFIHDGIIMAMKYAGNVSYALDELKVAHAGLDIEARKWAPRLKAVPIHFDCKVVGEVKLGTHVMFLGEVCKIIVRDDVTHHNPLEWYPWAAVRPVASALLAKG
jgi:flavin reductase (DIM6/NTAB) family NADH-FMN oxidoreductase RutF